MVSKLIKRINLYKLIKAPKYFSHTNVKEAEKVLNYCGSQGYMLDKIINVNGDGGRTSELIYVMRKRIIEPLK